MAGSKKILARKLKISVVATILSTFVLSILVFIIEGFKISDLKSGFAIELVALIGSIFLGVILLYGVPISILINHMTRKIQGTRRTWISLIYFILFGSAFFFITSLIEFFDPPLYLNDLLSYWKENFFYLISSMVASIFFWLTEEFLFKN